MKYSSIGSFDQPYHLEENRLALNKRRAPGTGYRDICAAVLDHIHSGRWRAGHRVPSESELTLLFGVSKMTVARATQELVKRRAIFAIRGIGYFVQPLHYNPNRPQDMDTEPPTGVGFVRTARVLRLSAENALPTIASHLGINIGETVFCLLAVRDDGGSSLKVEESYVRGECAPQFLSLDFRHRTALDYLQSELPRGNITAEIAAVMPLSSLQRIGGFPADKPCIQVQRKFTSESKTLLFSRMTGGSYRISKGIIS